MASKLLLRARLAVILSFLGLTVVQAQTVIQGQSAPKAITPQYHNLATQGGTIQSAKGQTSGQQQAVAIGWYFVHATTCLAYFDGVTNWVYLYPLEGGFWITANSNFENTWLSECPHNNLVAMYVFTTTGLFNQVFAYSHP